MTKAEVLKKRTFDFAVEVFRICRPLMRTSTNQESAVSNFGVSW
jgi:hypothetical protein